MAKKISYSNDWGCNNYLFVNDADYFPSWWFAKETLKNITSSSSAAVKCPFICMYFKFFVH